MKNIANRVERSLEVAVEAAGFMSQVRDSRRKHMPAVSQYEKSSPELSADRLSGDNGDTNIRDLGIGISVTFGTPGLGILAVDALVNSNIESIGYGSLALGLFGAAVALREVKIDLESRQ